MINKSIAYRLKIFISLAVICVFLAFIFADFLFNRNLLRENIENKAIRLSSEINSLVNQNVVTTKEVTKNVAGQILYYGKNENAEEFLSMVMKKYLFLNSIYVKIDSSMSLSYNYHYLSRENENLLFKQGKHPVFFCQPAQEVIENIPYKNISGWTEPYRSSEKGNVVVAFYTPVIIYTADEEPVFAGQVISELSLTGLNEALNQIKVGKRGYAFLINKSGDYLTHPNESWILNQNICLLPAKVLDRQKINLEELLSTGQTFSTVVYPEHLNYEKYWAYVSPIEETRWFLIFTISYHEFFSELYRGTFRLIIFSLLGIILIYFVISYITNKLIAPLSNVTSMLTRFSIPVEKGRGNTKNEVKLVSDSLEYLKAWFEQYRIALEEEELSSLRWKQDLQQASEIQQSLIKTTFPAFPNRNDIDLYAIYKPARTVSGDLFDYFFIDDENLVFTIGDVSGKGIPAAIFMSVAQTIIKNNSSFKKAKTIVKKANTELCISNSHQFFLTLFLGVLNVKKGELNFCNAAHIFPYILKSNGKITELASTHGLPLGLYPDKGYTDARVKLESGDSLILFTDGVIELQNDLKTQFGRERFKESLKKPEGLSPSEIVNRMNKRMENFKGDSPQSDDICLFVIKYKP